MEALFRLPLLRILGLGAVLALAPGPSSSAAVVRGRVADPHGRGLAGVRLVLLVGESLRPVATAASNDAGSFTFAEIADGVYEIAASKDGYGPSVGAVDTALDRALDLVLRPAGSAPRPRSSAWALRLPRRSVLHDLEPVELPDAVAANEPKPELDGPSTVRVEQWLAAGADPAGAAGEVAEAQAGATRLEIASDVGERGGVTLRGSRESADAGGVDSAAHARRGSSAMRLGVSYATDPRSHLDVLAFYGERDHTFHGGLPSATAAFGGEQRTWGYGAGWSADLDDRNRIGVTMGYRNLAVHDAGGREDRRASASGSYRRRQTADHDIEVELRAWIHEGPVVSEDAFADAPGSSASVRVDLSDTWTVTPALDLAFGVAHQEAELSQQATVTAPRVGASWGNDGGVRVRGQLHFDHVRKGPSVGPFVDPALAHWGYDTEVELPLADGVLFHGRTLYAPIRFGDEDVTEGAPIHPMYLVHDGVSVREHRFALVERRGATRTRFELAHGRAKGGLTPLLPWSAVTVVGGAGAELRYRSAVASVFLDSRATDLRLEYLRLDGRDAVSESGGGAVEESFEMRVRTALGESIAPGTWSLLLAVQVADLENGDLAAWKEAGGDDAALDALNRRVSAGFAVTF